MMQINNKKSNKEHATKLFGFDYENFQPFQQVYLPFFVESVEESIRNTTAFNEFQAGIQALEKRTYDKAERHFNLALLSEGGDYLEIKLFTAIGHLLLIKGAYSKATDVFMEALALAKEDNDLVFIYMGIAKVYQALNDYKKALQYYSKVHWICANVLENPTLEALSRVNLSSLYFELYKYEKAKKEIEPTIEVFELISNPRQLVNIYAMLADCYHQQRKTEDALLYLNKAFDIANTRGLLRTASKVLYRMGCLYFSEGNEDKGKLFMTEALVQAEQMGDSELSGEILKTFSSIHIIENRIMEATQYIKQSIQNFEQEKDYANLEAAYEALVNIYENNGSYREALKYSRKMAETRWSAYSEQQEKERLATQLTKRAKQLIHEREINLLRKRNELQEDLLAKKRYIELQNEQLQQANEEFMRLAYTAAHDLKQPLRSIGSFTQLLKHSLDESLDNDEQEYMKFVLEGVVQMDALLKDLMRYCELKMPDAHLKKVDLNEVLQVVNNNLAADIQKHKVTINAENLPTVLASYNEIVQLFEQLIDNSIKFRNNQPPIIDIKVKSEQHDYIFSVQDNGKGMPSSYCNKAFKLFHCLNAKKDNQGNGIGLSICQKIISGLHGKIWIESEVNQGCTVFFSIPK